MPAGEASSAVNRAVATAADKSADPDLRADSIGLIALAGPQPHEALLKKLIDPHEPDQVQAAAVRAAGHAKAAPRREPSSAPDRPYLSFRRPGVPA